jgi:thiol-disulfide isomerase/thioredoxin
VTLFTRYGLAIIRPRAALALAGDRRHAGRSGSDLLVGFALVLVATQLRWLVQATWLGVAVAPSPGIRALVHVLTTTFTIDLGLLVIAAAIIWFAAGPRRELGRAFDLACVTALPPVFVQLAAQTIISISSIAPPVSLQWTVAIASYAWMAGLVVVAVIHGLRGEPGVPDIPRGARRAGWVVGTIAACGLAVQLQWVVQNIDLVRPLEPGSPAPAIALPKIGPRGQLGPRVSLAPGRVTIVDFWATWCGPCLRAMPHLDRFARRHPDIDVLAINLDDAAEARAMFDSAGYALTLLADDGDTSQRYGVDTIPHTAVIDRTGRLFAVGHGGLDLDAAIAELAR